MMCFATIICFTLLENDEYYPPALLSPYNSLVMMKAQTYICTTMATLRNLNIKTLTCKRIVKELHSYEKEVEKESAKTAEMKAKGADPYDLKQQVRRALFVSK